MNKVELAICRIREKIPNNQGFVTLGSGCVVKCEELAESLGWKCPNLIVTSSAVLTPEHLALDRIFLAEFLVREKRGFEVFDLKLAAEYCENVPSRAASDKSSEKLANQLPEEGLTVISVEPLDKRGFLKRMVKKSSLQTTRPISCYEFHNANFQSEFSEGFFCNVIREFGSSSEDFETRTYKFGRNEETSQFILQNFGGPPILLDLRSFPDDQQPLGGVIFSKYGEFAGTLGYYGDQIEPCFMPEAIAQVTESQEEKQANNNLSESQSLEGDSRQKTEEDEEQPTTADNEVAVAAVSVEQETEELPETVQDTKDSLCQSDENLVVTISVDNDEPCDNVEMSDQRVKVFYSDSERESVPETTEIPKRLGEGSELGENIDREPQNQKRSEHGNVESRNDVSGTAEMHLEGTLSIDEAVVGNELSQAVISQDSELEVKEGKEEMIEQDNNVSSDLHVSPQEPDVQTNQNLEGNENEVNPVKIGEELEITIDNIVWDSNEEKNVLTEVNSPPNALDIEGNHDTVLEMDSEVISSEETSDEIFKVKDSASDGIETELLQNTVDTEAESETRTDVVDDNDLGEVCGSDTGICKSDSDDFVATNISTDFDNTNSPTVALEAEKNPEEFEKDKEESSKVDTNFSGSVDIVETKFTRNEEQCNEDNVQHQEEYQQGLLDHDKGTETEFLQDNTDVEESKDAMIDNDTKTEMVEDAEEQFTMETSGNTEKVEVEPSSVEINGDEEEPEPQVHADGNETGNTLEEKQEATAEQQIEPSTEEKTSPIPAVLETKCENQPENIANGLQASEPWELEKVKSTDVPKKEQTKQILDKESLPEVGLALEPDALLSTTVTNNPNVLEDLARCLDTEYQCGGVPCWRDLAELLAIPPEAYEHCSSFSETSPTEDLLMFLAATKPQLTVSDVKDALRAIDRNDVVHILERCITRSIISNESVVGSLVERDDTDLLGQVALKLDPGYAKNWKALAVQMEIPRRVFRNFGSHQRHNSALLLLKYLPIFDPDLTVKSLKYACQGITRFDVVKVLDLSGIPDDDPIKDILDDADFIDELTDLLNEEGHNWRQLAHELRIPDEKCSIFEPGEKRSPTKMLLRSIEKCEPDLTVEELILALVAMKRQDIIELLGKHYKRDDIKAILEENNCLPPESVKCKNMDE